MNLIKPQKLEKGDLISTISLSWGGAFLFPYRYEAGIQELNKHFNLQVMETPSVYLDNNVLKQNPKIKAENLMAAFKDKSIKAIITTIGGNDAINIYPFLDLSVIKNNPKIFMGYSDTTVNHLMCLKAGLSSFYGPSIMSGFAENGGMSEYSIQSVKKCLFTNQKIGRIFPSSLWSGEFLSWDQKENQQIRRKRLPTKWNFLQGKDIVHGQLIGGCLETLNMLKRTELFPSLDDFNGAILFLESSDRKCIDTNELFGWLEYFGNESILERINGMIIGRPGETMNPIDLDKFDAIVSSVLKKFSLTSLPVISRMDFGHTDPMFIIPYGRYAEINPLEKTFSILESSVT